MSELDKLSKKRAGLAQDLEAVRGKLREKRVEFGRLAITPKSDPFYSYARYSNLEKDIAHLAEQEAGLAFDLEQAELAYTLAAIPKPSPEQQAARAAQAARDKRRREIESDLARARADLESKRGGLGAAILAGADPAALVGKITQLESQERGLLAALNNG
jgi:DNA repair exonuclease SbcCD ATPase subunit